MAFGPIDYSIDVQQPIQAALQGYQAGAAIRNDQLQQQQQLLAQQQAQRQQQLLTRLASNPNATADDYASVMTQIPSLAEHLQKAWTTKNTAQQQAAASDMLRWGAAIKSGQPQIAADEMVKRAEAMEYSSGGGQNSSTPTPESQALRAQAQLVRDHPEFALGQFQAALSVNPNGKQAADALASFGKETRDQQLQAPVLAKANADASTAQSSSAIRAEEAKVAPELQKQAVQKGWEDLKLTRANISNLNSQISTRAGQLSLDNARLALETQKFLAERQDKLTDIGQDGRKLVNDSAVAAGASKLSADRANDLANRITDIGSSWGSLGSFSEWIKKTTGEQGKVSQLRQEYTRLRNAEGVKNLPPGAASDTDVKLAFEGFPPDTADPKTIQSFLRGMAKMNDINAAVENARADYVSNNRGLLGRARGTFSAGGTDVKSGDDWTTISKRVAESAARKYAPKDDKLDDPDGYVDENGVPGRRVIRGGSGATGSGAAPTKRSGAGVTVDWSDIRDN